MRTPALLVTSLLLALVGFASTARAATVITAGTDAELRAAVAACGPITFNFNGVITLTNTIDVTCAVTMDATGHAVTISGGNSNRIFQVLPGGSLELINLTIANGRVVGTNSNPGSFPNAVYGFSGGSAEGGGVLVSNAAFTARSCVFQHCSVQGGNGADTTIIVYAGRAGLASGAAIYGTNSSITLLDCTFQSNSANAGFTGTTFRQTGGIFDPPQIGEANGGAACLMGGSLISSNGQFFHNTGTTRGGALALYGQTDSLLHQNTFAQNSSSRGGAVYCKGQPLFTTRSSFQLNSGTTFGGAMELDGGTATLTDCDFVGNQSSSGGDGGALGQTSGIGVLSRCTFRENSAARRGGAIYWQQGSLELNNCTLAYNSVVPGVANQGLGGALAFSGGLQVIQFCTIASNRIHQGHASSAGGGLHLLGGASADLASSIFQGNTVNAVSGNISGPALFDFGHNLSSDATPAWTSGTSLNNTDARLLPLAANGGPTLTMSLRPGSPALNFADPGAIPATDQRGVARPQGPGPDVGAWEGAGGQFDLRVQRQPGFPQLNTLSWPTDTGVTYRVERAAPLNNWNILATNIPGTGATVFYNVTNTGAAYFRVATEP